VVRPRRLTMLDHVPLFVQLHYVCSTTCCSAACGTRCRWDLVCRWVKRFKLVDIPAGRLSMQVRHGRCLLLPALHDHQPACARTAGSAVCVTQWSAAALNL
jgi:hypothetical protein